MQSLSSVVRWSPIRSITATTPWPPAKLHTQIHAAWKPLRDTQRDWSPSVVLISLPPTRARRYQLCQAIYFLKRSVSCVEHENNGAVSFFSQRNCAGCKGQEVHRETVTSDESRFEPFLTPALVLLDVSVCALMCAHITPCTTWTVVGMQVHSRNFIHSCMEKLGVAWREVYIYFIILQYFIVDWWKSYVTLLIKTWICLFCKATSWSLGVILPCKAF